MTYLSVHYRDYVCSVEEMCLVDRRYANQLSDLVSEKYLYVIYEDENSNKIFFSVVMTLK